MITKIQTVTQKHHKVIFGILLILIIIAFVFTVGSSLPYFGDNHGGGVAKNNKYYDFDLSDSDQVREVQVCAQLTAILEGQGLGNDSDKLIESLMYRYMYFVSMGNKINVRTVSDAEFKAYIHSRPVFLQQDGSFNEEGWNNFLNNFPQYFGLKKEYLASLLPKIAVVEKIQNIVSGPGYILPEEIASQYKRTNGTWDIQIAKLSFETFKPEIKYDDAVLKTYYEANKESFKLSDAVGLDVALIPANSKVEEATEEEAKAFYERSKERYAETKDGKQDIPAFEAIKSKVIADVKTEKSVYKTSIAAENIVVSLYDKNVKFDENAFKNMVKDNEALLKPQSLAKFRPEDGKDKLPAGIPLEVLAAGYHLNADKFYGDPVRTEQGTWIVFFREREAAYIPEFEACKARVEEVYKNSEKERLFAEYGKNLSESIKKGVAEGKELNACVELDKVEVLAAKNFSLAKPTPEMQDVLEAYYVLQGVLPNMKAGSVSEMMTSRNNGYVVYVSKMTEPAVDPNAVAYKGLAKRLQQSYKDAAAVSVISTTASQK